MSLTAGECRDTHRADLEFGCISTWTHDNNHKYDRYTESFYFLLFSRSRIKPKCKQMHIEEDAHINL